MLSNTLKSKNASVSSLTEVPPSEGGSISDRSTASNNNNLNNYDPAGLFRMVRVSLSDRGSSDRIEAETTTLKRVKTVSDLTQLDDFE